MSYLLWRPISQETRRKKVHGVFRVASDCFGLTRQRSLFPPIFYTTVYPPLPLRDSSSIRFCSATGFPNFSARRDTEVLVTETVNGIFKYSTETSFCYCYRFTDNIKHFSAASCASARNLCTNRWGRAR